MVRCTSSILHCKSDSERKLPNLSFHSKMAKPNAIITTRKKKNLESTMMTLKHNLTTTIPSKKGTRVKSKPRNLPRKETVLPQKIETCLMSYGEFYPNKLKRKKTQKSFLKPKHEYKVVVSTNKRKRNTPKKGLISFDDELPTILSAHSTDEAQSPQQDIKTPSTQDIQKLDKEKSCKSLLKVQTPRSLEMVNYKLISPPHKSLTDLTAEDLMRMDNDSLSDEDMMEILTCPSPVWWEEPSDNCKEGDLFLFEAHKNSRVIPTDDKLKETDVNAFCANSSNLDINLCTNVKTVSKMKTKTKKEKLEHILGHIKNKKYSGDNDHNDRLEINNNPNDFANDHHNVDMKKINDNKANESKNSVDGQDIGKPRKLSSSCSDNSVNEDDLLRNLESIDIPIQVTENVSKDLNIATNSSNKNNKNNENDVANIDKVFGKNTKVFKGKFVQEYRDIYNMPNDPAKQRKRLKSDENKKNKIHSMRMKKGGQKDTLGKSENKTEEKKDTPAYTDILKRLKPQTDDILDVRLIKTPTKTNEIKVWSKLDNFKRHSYKPEYFTDIVDVEDELAFSMIISPAKKQDPLDISKPRTETILIEDDDSDNDIDKATVEEIVNDAEITKANDDITVNSPKATHPHEDMMDIPQENIIKEDTIKIGNDIDVRLIETSPETKDKKKNKVNMVVKDPPQTYTIAQGHGKIGLLKLLPIETLKETLSTTDDNSCIYSTKEPEKFIDSDATTKAYSEHKVTLIKKPEQNYTYENIDTESALLNKVRVRARNLPVLIQKPTFDSPKSINSFISVASEGISIENSEGTISDTNIEFIDDYEGRVQYTDEESQSSQTDEMKEQEFVSDTDGDRSFDEERDNSVQKEKNDNLDQDKFDNINQRTAEKTINKRNNYNIHSDNFDIIDTADETVNTENNDDKIPGEFSKLNHKNAGKATTGNNTNPDKVNTDTVIYHTETFRKCADEPMAEDSKVVKENLQDELIKVNKANKVIKTYSKKAIT